MLFYVGTTTAATITDKFNGSAPLWAQFIDGESVATNTPAGVWADNIQGHKSTWPGQIAVQPGQSLVLVMDDYCVNTGKCETATSSNRGFTTVVFPFTYWNP